MQNKYTLAKTMYPHSSNTKYRWQCFLFGIFFQMFLIHCFHFCFRDSEFLLNGVVLDCWRMVFFLRQWQIWKHKSFKNLKLIFFKCSNQLEKQALYNYNKSSCNLYIMMIWTMFILKTQTTLKIKRKMI